MRKHNPVRPIRPLKININDLKVSGYKMIITGMSEFKLRQKIGVILIKLGIKIIKVINIEIIIPKEE